MSLATNLIKAFVAANYRRNEIQFLRDAVEYFNGRNETINQRSDYEALLLDFIDSFNN